MKKHYNVVAAAVVAADGRILCVQRGMTPFPYTSMKWEFPGGKCEAGESEEEALRRELREELSCDVEPYRHVGAVEHEYPDFSIRLSVYLCRAHSDFRLSEHVACAFLRPDELRTLDWAEADDEIIRTLEQTIV